MRIERLIENTSRGKCIEAFIKPRVLELVVSHHPVPELVSRLMDGYTLWGRYVTWG